jgi:hypothetical protein
MNYLVRFVFLNDGPSAAYQTMAMFRRKADALAFQEKIRGEMTERDWSLGYIQVREIRGGRQIPQSVEIKNAY